MLVAALLFGVCSPLCAQTPPQPTPEKKEPEPAKAEPPKAPETYTRDSSTMIVYYALALVGTIVVMVIICLPARRD